MKTEQTKVYDCGNKTEQTTITTRDDEEDYRMNRFWGFILFGIVVVICATILIYSKLN